MNERTRLASLYPLVIALFAVLCLARPALAEPPTGRATLTLEGLEGRPQFAVSPEGEALLAWWARPQEGETPHLYLARSPSWAPQDLGALPPGAAVGDVLLRPGREAALAWSYSTTRTEMIQWVVPGSPWPAPQAEPFRAWRAYALDGALWAVAWRTEEGLAIRRGAGAITETIPLAPQASLEALRLAIDAQGGGHIAWAIREEPGVRGGIYYASVVRGAVPVPIWPRAREIALSAGPDGVAHLAWVEEDVLYYASSIAWQTPISVAQGLTDMEALALAAGPDATARLVWASEGRLWTISSTQWGRPTFLAEGVSPNRLMAGVDGRDRLHVMWISAEAPQQAHYLLVDRPPLQVQVVYPIEGEMITEETLARAESNAPYGWVERVAFYLEEKEGTLYSLGVDQTEADGWAVPLSPNGLRRQGRYRVVAFAAVRGGEILRAEGGWFRAQPPEEPAVWLYLQGARPMRGQGVVWAWVPPESGGITDLDLYAVPARTAFCEGDGSPCPLGVPLYLGHYPFRQEGGAQRLSFPLEALQDGPYLLKAHLDVGDGQTAWVTASSPMEVERTARPRVEIVSPKGAWVSGERFFLAAQVAHPFGVVQRVDFYLERASERQADAPPTAPSLLWVGSDSDGVDGWAVPVMANAFWQGGPWYAWAIAYDAEGLSVRARSAEPFTILGPTRAALKWLSPTEGAPLQGTVPIEAAVTQGQGPLAVEAYLETGGALQPLGLLTQEGASWRRDWDTTVHPDGAYRLLLLSVYEGGWYDFLYSPLLRIGNGSAPWALLAEPDSGRGMFRGEVTLSLAWQGKGPAFFGESAPRAVRLFLREADGPWLPIAEGSLPGALGPGEAWRTVWNTRTVLDGDYTLIALVASPDGGWARLERPFSIRNETPSLAFGPLRDVWRGQERITWQIDQPVDRPITVTALYSPSGQDDWLLIGHALPGEDSLLWDTRAAPDSGQGRLRLTACNGLRCASAVSDLIRVDNANEAPLVALLSPSLGEPQSGAVPIAWEVWDPDGDEMTLTLEFRRGGEPWSLLRSGLPSSGRFVWDVSALLPGDDYALRLTAQDARGAQGAALVEGLVIRRNAPPTVRLVWPNEGVRLVDRTAILYQASDRDRDTLTISLYYSDNGGQTWLPIAEGVENTGYYLWQVSFLPPGAQYRVRVAASDGLATAYDESDGVFAIGAEEPPRVSLQVASGEVLSGLQVVRWGVSDAERRAWRVQIALRPVGGSRWLTLAEAPAGVGAWLWNTRPWPDGAYELRLALYEAGAEALGPPAAVDAKPVRIANAQNLPPRVELLAPQGGEIWSGIHEIAWQATDADSRVLTATIHISRDGGASWEPIATVDAHPGWALWDAGAFPPGQTYLVRLRVSDGQNEVSARSAGTFAVAQRRAVPPEIAFASLDGVTISTGRDVISWRAADADGDALTVALWVSEDRERWLPLASRLANTGQYLLPTPLPDQPLWLRLTVDDGLYRTGYVWFAPPSLRPYAPPVEITLEAPQAGDLLSGMAWVRWRAAVRPVEQAVALDLDASADGGLTWQPLARDLPNTGSYAWDTTIVPNGTYRLRITAKGETFSRTYLSGTFQVHNDKRSMPIVSLLAPQGGEVWWGMQEIRWRAEDADGDRLTMNLAYSTDRGATWEPLAFSIPNTGFYVWDTTALPNSEEVWFRLSASDGLWTAWTVSNGPVALRNPLVPSVRLLVNAPTGRWQGVQAISWKTSTSGRTPRVTLRASVDGGPWQVLARDLDAQGTLEWATAQVPEGAQVRLQAIASAGVTQGIDTRWEPILVRGNQRFRPPFYPR